MEEIQRDCVHAGKKIVNKRGPSVHILADSRINNWPTVDNVCAVDFRQDWSFKQWISALRAEIIRVKCHTVILYLEKVQEYDQVPPLKNALQTVCKIIKQHSRDARIFMSNLLPHVSQSPIRRKPLAEVNFTLLQAVQSVNRAMGGKIHFLSVYEHFVSHKGKIIWPTHKFFQEDNVQLSLFGCMILRECFLCEAGLKPYWFK